VLGTDLSTKRKVTKLTILGKVFTIRSRKSVQSCMTEQILTSPLKSTLGKYTSGTFQDHKKYSAEPINQKFKAHTPTYSRSAAPFAAGFKNSKNENQSVHQLGESDGCRLSVATNHQAHDWKLATLLSEDEIGPIPHWRRPGWLFFYPARFFWIVFWR
jgi:hypothetical protein